MDANDDPNTMLVSVIVPTHDRAAQLVGAVESVLTQTYQKLELIVIDDGSTDGTAELMEHRYGGESRLSYVWQEQAGVAHARNTGLSRARGELVAFLDSDDLWQPWKLSLQLECLRRAPEAGLVWTNMLAIDPAGNTISGSSLADILSNYHRFGLEQLFSDRISLAELPDAPSDAQHADLWVGNVFSKMVIGNLVLPSSSLLTRERLSRVERFDERFEVAGEDFDFFLRISESGPVAFADVPGVLKRVGQSDQLSDPSRHLYLARNYVRTMEAALERNHGRIDLPAGVVQGARAEGYAWAARAYLELGDARAARQYLRRSRQLRARDPRTLAMSVFALLPGAVSARVFRLLRRLLEAARRRSERRE